MRRPLLKLVLIWGMISVTVGVSYAPVCFVQMYANLFTTRFRGWSDFALRIKPTVPYQENCDRMILFLPLCPSIKEVSLPLFPGRRDRLARIAKSPWIKSLVLSSVALVDDDLAVLSDMPDLEWISLEGSPEITDAGIAHLAKCTKLRHLGLRNTSVTGTGLAALANCQELRTLELDNCPVTDETAVMIPCFTKLTKIRLAGTQLTDVGSRHFLEWPSLTDFVGSFQLSREMEQELHQRCIDRRDRAEELQKANR